MSITEAQIKEMGFESMQDFAESVRAIKEKSNSNDGLDLATAKELGKAMAEGMREAQIDKNAKEVRFPEAVADNAPDEVMRKDPEAQDALVKASLLSVISRDQEYADRFGRLSLKDALKHFGGPGKRVIRAMDTAETNGGKEWFYTALGNTLLEQIRLDTIVRGLFPWIDMPTNPFKLPSITAGPTVYLVAENTADTGQTSATASQLTTADETLTARTLGTLSRFSHELDLRSVIALLPEIQRQIVIGMREAEEYAIINGDTSTSSNITTAGGGTSAAERWGMCDGLRHAVHGSSDTNQFLDGSSEFKVAQLRIARGSLGKWGASPSRLAIVTNTETYMKMISWSEVQTLDKYGPRAVILTGELSKVDGIPVIVSSQLPLLYSDDTLDSTPTNNTKGTMILCHRDAFRGGNWDALRIKTTDEPIEYDQTKIASFLSEAFTGLWLSSGTSPAAGLIYNITV
jgi:HK97 family phage major capsid protein